MPSAWQLPFQSWGQALCSWFTLQVMNSSCYPRWGIFDAHHACLFSHLNSLREQWEWQALSTRQRTKLFYDDVSRSASDNSSETRKWSHPTTASAAHLALTRIRKSLWILCLSFFLNVSLSLMNAVIHIVFSCHVSDLSYHFGCQPSDWTQESKSLIFYMKKT